MAVLTPGLGAQRRSGARGSCRVFRRRTIATVRRAITSWCRIFSQDPCEFSPQVQTCGELIAAVKQRLASCPSPCEEHRIAFQSIKKLLPPSCRCLQDGFLDRLVQGMTGPERPVPRGYQSFARRVAKELFPCGWDRTYRDHCYTFTLPLSSTLEHTRCQGGATAADFHHSEYLDLVLQDSSRQLDSICKPMVVQSAGKPRPLTKYNEDMYLLGPLHKSLYDNLSRFKWLARGEISSDLLDSAGFSSEVGSLVSGDYSSATDNLPLSVATSILEVALERSSRVPESIRSYARAALRPLLDYGGQRLVVSSGQQMGSLLSFPLLCVQNYIAFRWALFNYKPCGYIRYYPDDLPLLINGDDILFQVDDPAFFPFWVSTVKDVGLDVELTKTSFDPSFGSFNSTLLRWSGTHLRVVPTVRMGMLKAVDYPNSLSTSFRSFTRGLPGAHVRYQAALEFLRWHRSSILSTNLSALELGFSGRLAWRAFEKMGLNRLTLRRVANKENLKSSLPPAPVLHNFVLSGADVQFVESLSDEEKKMSSRQMASWKWSLCGRFEKKRAAFSLGYWMALSRPPFQSDVVRVPEFRFSGQFLTSGPPREVYKKSYFAPRPKQPRRYPFFMGLDRLPSYDEAVAGDGCHLETGPTLSSVFGLDVKDQKWSIGVLPCRRDW